MQAASNQHAAKYLSPGLRPEPTELITPLAPDDARREHPLIDRWPRQNRLAGLPAAAANQRWRAMSGEDCINLQLLLKLSGFFWTGPYNAFEVQVLTCTLAGHRALCSSCAQTGRPAFDPASTFGTFQTSGARC